MSIRGPLLVRVGLPPCRKGGRDRGNEGGAPGAQGVR